MGGNGEIWRMTTKERFLRMYEHREADRVPIIDSPWAGTIRRWQNEGMPQGVAWEDFFGVDKTAEIGRASCRERV